MFTDISKFSSTNVVRNTSYLLVTYLALMEKIEFIHTPWSNTVATHDNNVYVTVIRSHVKDFTDKTRFYLQINPLRAFLLVLFYFLRGIPEMCQ